MTIFAKKANLKRILSRVADEADILFKFPQDLSKRITIKLSGVPIRKALRRLLRGENYAVVYEGGDISEVYVVPKSSARSRSRNYGRSPQREDRIRASIGRYEKRLETLKDRMARVDKSSRRGKIIMRQRSDTHRCANNEKLYGASLTVSPYKIQDNALLLWPNRDIPNRTSLNHYFQRVRPTGTIMIEYCCAVIVAVFAHLDTFYWLLEMVYLL